MRTRALDATLAVVLFVAVGAGCGGNDDNSPESVRDDLTEDLQSTLGLSKDDADCFAGVLVDEVGAEELAAVDFTADEPPEDLAEEISAAALSAVEDCEIDPASLGG